MSAIPIAGRHDPPDPIVPPFPRNYFSIGDVTVELSGETAHDVELGSQLSPFGCEPRATDIEVRIEWHPHLEASRAKELFHSGSLWTAHERKGRFLFDFTTERLGTKPYKRLLADDCFRKAEVWLNREFFSPEEGAFALEYPLDELLITHYLSLGRGVELHACGLIHAGGESFLFVGHSGAGKSTTARLWSRHLGVEVLSDDRIILRKNTDRFLMYGTPWHGEAAFASPQQTPVRQIFVLEHGSENRVERIPPAAAVGALLARSFAPFYQPRFVEPVLAWLEELVAAVPCYRFQFVPDRTAVERILEFRD